LILLFLYAHVKIDKGTDRGIPLLKNLCLSNSIEMLKVC